MARMQTAAEMFVMVLDVHKWVPLPAIAARAKQSSSAAVPAGTLAVHWSTQMCFSPFSKSTAGGIAHGGVCKPLQDLEGCYSSQCAATTFCQQQATSSVSKVALDKATSEDETHCLVCGCCQAVLEPPTSQQIPRMLGRHTLRWNACPCRDFARQCASHGLLRTTSEGCCSLCQSACRSQVLARERVPLLQMARRRGRRTPCWSTCPWLSSPTASSRPSTSCGTAPCSPSASRSPRLCRCARGAAAPL